MVPRRPFRHKARSPRVRTHSFSAQPPDLRRFVLITRASRSFARSPCSAAPSIRFLSIGSQITIHASFPRSVTLTQLRFTSFAVINLRRDLHPQECARAGRTKTKSPNQAIRAFVLMLLIGVSTGIRTPVPTAKGLGPRPLDDGDSPKTAISGAAEESRTLDLNLGKVALYQLSYCRVTFGSSTWARTRDLRINSPALYRLSYRGTEGANYIAMYGEGNSRLTIFLPLPEKCSDKLQGNSHHLPVVYWGR